MADYGSYFVTTLNRTKLKKNKKRIRIRKKPIVAVKIQTYVVISPSEKVFGLYSKNEME